MPRKTVPLTATQVKNAKTTDKELSLLDGGGLVLLVKPSGVKTWQLRYYRPANNKRTTMTIGNYPSFSLLDARAARDEARAMLDKGIDPQDYRTQQEEAEKLRTGNTFKNVAADWYELKKSQNLAPNTIKDIWRSLEKYIFPDIGDRPVTELTARIFVNVLEPIRARGNLETLKRVLQRVNEVMDYAANSGLIEVNTAANVRKAFPVPTKKPIPAITPDRLPELMRALSIASIERQTRLLIEWQLITVTRPAEASSARWDEIDLVDQTWTIPAGRMKMRRDHVIPLPPQALAILEEMKPISKHRDYVFPSMKDPKQPMNSQTANAALKRMGFRGVLVAHGFRAIFSTAANSAGFDSDIIESALSHTDKNEVRRAYNRSNYLERRKVLMCWWADTLEAAATGSTLANGVIGIRSKLAV